MKRNASYIGIGVTICITFCTSHEGQWRFVKDGFIWVRHWLWDLSRLRAELVSGLRSPRSEARYGIDVAVLNEFLYIFIIRKFGLEEGFAG